MKLIQKLEREIGGYWDGGSRSVFSWFIDGPAKSDKKGQFVRVGSMDANYWFHVALGKTEKMTLANARRKLMAMARKSGLKATFTYTEEE